MNALQPVFVLALDTWAWVLIGIGGLIVLIGLLFVGQYFSLWLQAKLSNASVTFFSLIGMRLRKVKPDVVVLNRISAKKAGLDLPTNNLEAHYLAGGNISRVVRAMIATPARRHPSCDVGSGECLSVYPFSAKASRSGPESA